PEGWFFAAEAEGRRVPVEAHAPDNAVDKLFVAVCDRQPRGGGLGNQTQEAEKVAGEGPLVGGRSTACPANPTSDVTKPLAVIVKKGGRKVVVENADWRAMLAFREFRDTHAKEPSFADWVRAARPLTQLAALRRVLNLDNWPKPRPTEVPLVPACQ